MSTKHKKRPKNFQHNLTDDDLLYIRNKVTNWRVDNKFTLDEFTQLLGPKPTTDTYFSNTSISNFFSPHSVGSSVRPPTRMVMEMLCAATDTAITDWAPLGKMISDFPVGLEGYGSHASLSPETIASRTKRVVVARGYRSVRHSKNGDTSDPPGALLMPADELTDTPDIVPAVGGVDESLSALPEQATQVPNLNGKLPIYLSVQGNKVIVTVPDGYSVVQRRLGTPFFVEIGA